LGKKEALENFEVKIKELKAELKKTMSEMISLKMGSVIKGLLAQYEVEGEVANIQWDFYPESDDEGGTIWYPEGIELEVDGNYIEMSDLVVERKSKWSDSVYEHDLAEDMNELLNDISNTFYEADVTSLTINLLREEE